MLGSRMRRTRLAKGLTQKDLAEPRYTHAYVSTIESGRRNPSREALEYFAGKLGVEVDELLTGRPPGLEGRLELRVQEARVALSSGRADEAATALPGIMKEAKRYGLSRIEAKAEEAQGLLLERAARPEEALEHYERAEEILESEPPTAWVDAVAGRARCFHATGDVRYEIHVLESLLDEIQREGLRDPGALGRLHAGLVFAYIDAGLYAKAAESAAEIERLAPRITDPLRIAQMHMNVARLYLFKGKIRDAERSLQRAEDAYRQLNLKSEWGGAVLAKGLVLSREGKLDKARHKLEEALAIFEQTADEKDLARTLNELARLERREGHLERARELLERSISITQTSDTPILGGAHRELGIVLSEQDAGAAEKHFRSAVELFERTEQPFDIAVTYRALGDLLRSQGDADGGCEAYRTGILALEPHL